MVSLDIYSVDPFMESSWTDSGFEQPVLSQRFTGTDPWFSGSGEFNLPGDVGTITIGGGTGQQRPVITGGGGWNTRPAGFSNPNLGVYLMFGVLIVAAIYVLKK